MGSGLSILVGVLVFLALQLLLFAGYHFNIVQLEEEADIEHELQNQLRNLVEENHALQSRSEAADLLLAKERAKRTGLQLQLLRSGILPHDLSEGTGSAADKQKAVQAEITERQKAVEEALKGHRHVITSSFLNAPLTAMGAAQEAQVEQQGAVSQPQAAASSNQKQQRPQPQAIRNQPVRAVPFSEKIFPSSNEDQGCPVEHDPSSQTSVVAGVAVVALNRPQYLERTLSSIEMAIKRKPDWRDKFPLFVSQDGTDKGVRQTVLRHPEFRLMNHIETVAPKPLNRNENLAYYRIANHYKYILQTMFDCLQYKKAIILEDDMHLSLDFFEYFEATAPLLDEDKTIYAVSSWNDHGQSQFVANATQLYRSDFFPGLGWMLTRELWAELKPKWPRAYWDDWMRQTEHRKGRQSIRPEVCRTFNFGEQGASHGQFYKKYLATIHLNNEFVPFTTIDLSFLKDRQYKAYWDSTLEQALVLKVEDAMKATGVVKVQYRSQEEYEDITGKLGMLREWKDGVPRGAYEGVVPVRYQKARVFITPSEGFKAAERITGQVDGNGALLKKTP